MQEWKKKISERYAALLSEASPFFLKQDYDIEEFANDLVTNRSYASRFVKEVLGTSFPTLLNKLRLAYIIRTKHENPKEPIYRLAAAAGYKNAHSFRRAFYREHNMMPRAFFKKQGI